MQRKVNDVGVDTVKLSYPFGSGEVLDGLISADRDETGNRILRLGEFTSKVHNAGSNGPVRYRSWSHPNLRASVVIKGVPGSSVAAVYEGSLPKELGLCGAAPGECVGVLDSYIRGLFRETGLRFMPRPKLRRVDLTHDIHDPSGAYRAAALNWNPHARSRYVQSRYQDDETVWQHNKCRGVRVYDKFAECGEEWARGLSRIEYQIRGAWIEKYGLDVGCDWARKEESVLSVLVSDLGTRVSAAREVSL